MSYDINNKTSDIKESRSLSLNSIIALEGNIVASKAKDDFNNSYLFNPTFNINDTNYYPAVQDLISLYMMEFNLENGTTFTHPTLENYNKTGWEAIMVNALKDTGDGHFYPLIPGADVAAAFEEAGVSPGEMAETMAGLAGHLENDGTDHSFIGQDVKSSASPTFVKLTLTDAVDAQAIYVNGARKDLLWDSAIGGSHPPNNPGQLPPSELTGGDVLSQINTNEYGHVTGYKKRTLTADNINAAAKNQTMYIGTTAVAINRPAGALTLSGVSLSSLTFKSDGTGADPNTVYNGSAARNISWNTIGAASSNHVHTGTYAPINQTMYIGTTAVAINRPTGALTLSGVSLSSLTFKSDGTGADPNTVYNGSAARNISWNTIGAQKEITGAASSVTSNNLSNSVVVVTNSSGKLASGEISTTKLGYLTDVGSNIGASLSSLNTNITTTNTNLSNLQTAFNNHKNDTGADHSYIDQSVTTDASPSFKKITLTGASVPVTTPTIDNVPLYIPFSGTVGTERIYAQFNAVNADNTDNDGGGAFIHFRTRTSDAQNFGAMIGGIRKTGGGGALAFKTGAGSVAPSTQMYIDENGSVGINTTSPNSLYKLDVNGNVRFNQIYIGSARKDANWDTAYSRSHIFSDTTEYIPTTALDGKKVISRIKTNLYGHISGVETRELSPGDIGIANLTFKNNEAGDSSGTVYNGSTARTIGWSAITGQDLRTSASPTFAGLTLTGNINLSSTSYAYRINGNSVLSSTVLGSTVKTSSLTSVGIIGAGTWQGTKIAVNYGGTGLDTYAKGAIIYANDTNSLAALNIAAAGNVLISGTTPSWGKVSLASHVAPLPTKNRVLVSDATSGNVTESSITIAKLNFLSNVGSDIQTQLNGKQATITGAATTIASSNLTASRAVVSDSSGKIAASATTSTEIGFVSGVTSAIQTQLNGKAATNQIMYIGSTQVAINRPSADLALTGVSLSSLTFNSIRFSGGTYTGKSAVTVDLKEGHGDSVNPYASKDQGLFLATPVSGSGKPIFRGINKNDIPILNQSTTGQAGSVANSITFNNGGIGASSGTTFNGSEARTISWNTIGAASSNHNHNYAGSSTPGGAANSVANALTKGDGLSFGTASSYNGSAAVTITLGTPSPISTTSGDNVTSTSHTHSIVTTATGATNTVVKTDASGNIRAANTFEFGANAYIQYNSTAKSLQFGFV